MPDCIFCAIAQDQIPAAKIWEDKEFLAFLDNRPNTRGMTLIIPKDHYPSYIFDLEDQFYQRYFIAAKKVVRLLEKALNVPRVIMVMEGLGVDHAHLKLYPVYGLDKKFEVNESEKEVFFEKFPGYTTTQPGPPADPEELQNLAKKIRQYN